MDLFKNKKVLLLVLASVALFMIVIYLFPNIFSWRKNVSIKDSPEVAQIKKQSQDTSTESIKNDLENTKLEDIDYELEDIENEINASI